MARRGRPPKKRRDIGIPDLISVGLLALFCPPSRVDAILRETGRMRLPRFGGLSFTCKTETRVVMPRTRVAYPLEFRRQIVELFRNGRTLRELSEEFEPSRETIRNWIKQADLDAGHRSDGFTTPEREELRTLRKQNRRLQQERDILAKAAAWFARETGSIPPSSS